MKKQITTTEYSASECIPVKVYSAKYSSLGKRFKRNNHSEKLYARQRKLWKNILSDIISFVNGDQNNTSVPILINNISKLKGMKGGKNEYSHWQ